MEQAPIIRKKVVTLFNVRNDGVPVKFERDMQLERSHIVGVRMHTIETMAKAVPPSGRIIAPLPTVGEVPQLSVKWVDRHRENVYDNGPAFKFVMNTVITAPLSKPTVQRELYVATSWAGVNLDLSRITSLGDSVLSVAFEFFFIERDDLR